ncbi:hypothetical protein [Formosimonas limnophila]|nr:hypothetical protein [Formosimonas limnophila]
MKNPHPTLSNATSRTMMLAVMTLSLTGCALFGPKAIQPEQVKANGKQGYFVLSSEYDNQLKQINEANRKTTHAFAPAVFTMNFEKQGEAKPLIRQYRYAETLRVYEVKPDDGPFRLTKIGTLQKVDTYWQYTCQTYGVAGKPGYQRVCSNQPNYSPVYEWLLMDNTPTLTVAKDTIALYGKQDPQELKDSHTNVLLDKVKAQAETAGLTVIGF